MRISFSLDNAYILKYNVGMKYLKKHFGAIIALITVAALYSVLFLLGIGCPIKFISGLSCPGCGMTRATLALLRLDFGAALHFHPVSFVMPLIFGLLVFFYLKQNRLGIKVTVSVFITLMIAVYILRLALGSDIVTLTPKEGAIYRLVSRIISYFCGAPAA